MEYKERILEMYKDVSLRLNDAHEDARRTIPGSPEHDYFERLLGERQGYGRILKDLYGVKQTDLQAILDSLYGV